MVNSFLLIFRFGIFAHIFEMSADRNICGHKHSRLKNLGTVAPNFKYSANKCRNLYFPEIKISIRIIDFIHHECSRSDLGCSTSHSGGNLVDGLPPAPVLGLWQLAGKIEGQRQSVKSANKCEIRSKIKRGHPLTFRLFEIYVLMRALWREGEG